MDDVILDELKPTFSSGRSSKRSPLYDAVHSLPLWWQLCATLLVASLVPAVTHFLSPSPFHGESESSFFFFSFFNQSVDLQIGNFFFPNLHPVQSLPLSFAERTLCLLYPLAAIFFAIACAVPFRIFLTEEQVSPVSSGHVPRDLTAPSPLRERSSSASVASSPALAPASRTLSDATRATALSQHRLAMSAVLFLVLLLETSAVAHLALAEVQRSAADPAAPSGVHAIASVIRAIEAQALAVCYVQTTAEGRMVTTSLDGDPTVILLPTDSSDSATHNRQRTPVRRVASPANSWANMCPSVSGGLSRQSAPLAGSDVRGSGANLSRPKLLPCGLSSWNEALSPLMCVQPFFRSLLHNVALILLFRWFIPTVFMPSIVVYLVLRLLSSSAIIAGFCFAVHNLSLYLFFLPLRVLRLVRFLCVALAGFRWRHSVSTSTSPTSTAGASSPSFAAGVPVSSVSAEGSPAYLSPTPQPHTRVKLWSRVVSLYRSPFTYHLGLADQILFFAVVRAIWIVLLHRLYTGTSTVSFAYHSSTADAMPLFSGLPDLDLYQPLAQRSALMEVSAAALGSLQSPPLLDIFWSSFLNIVFVVAVVFFRRVRQPLSSDGFMPNSASQCGAFGNFRRAVPTALDYTIPMVSFVAPYGFSLCFLASLACVYQWVTLLLAHFILFAMLILLPVSICAFQTDLFAIFSLLGGVCAYQYSTLQKAMLRSYLADARVAVAVHHATSGQVDLQTLWPSAVIYIAEFIVLRHALTVAGIVTMSMFCMFSCISVLWHRKGTHPLRVTCPKCSMPTSASPPQSGTQLQYLRCTNDCINLSLSSSRAFVRRHVVGIVRAAAISCAYFLAVASSYALHAGAALPVFLSALGFALDVVDPFADNLCKYLNLDVPSATTAGSPHADASIYPSGEVARVLRPDSANSLERQIYQR